MAFGLKSGELLPEIGSWSIQYIIKKEGEKEDHVTEYTPKRCKEVCGQNKTDAGVDSCGWKQAGRLDIGKYYCSDVFKNNIRGDPYSKDYRYIKIAMKRCVTTAT